MNQIRRVHEHRPPHQPADQPPPQHARRRLLGTGLYVLSLLALAVLILAPSIATIAVLLVVGIPAGWMLMDPAGSTT